MISLDRQMNGDLQHTIALVDALGRDLKAIQAGHQPPGLATAPVLDHDHLEPLARALLAEIVVERGMRAEWARPLTRTELDALWKVWDGGLVRALKRFLEGVLNARERKRGFYTMWECDMLVLGSALTRKDTGWLRQSPHIGQHLEPIPGLISQEDINRVRTDWDKTCEDLYLHAKLRNREIERVARVHRDPFEPILVVLEADKPVAEYRKITEEIVRLMPDEAVYPLRHAEADRSFLLLRLGLHLGLRQRNMRELLVCRPGDTPRSERRLEELRRGELRWSDRDQGWEVLIPSVAFKTASSSFFGSKPFRLVLPDLADLYGYLSAYISRHRARLLGTAEDPGTFFVKSAKSTSADAAYDQNTFYEAWRLTVQRYGIYNPYTGHGAIKGLLPHGPHNIRDVLATHILKQTGSYEHASYAIQDTPEMVSKHYGRFLPQDKAGIAAQELNRVWADN